MASSTIRCKGKLISLQKPLVMGILNLSPESFYMHTDSESDHVIKWVAKMIHDGADIIDIGAASSKPGAEEISLEEELRRLLPPLETLVSAFPQAVFSVDTYRATVAEAALQVGAAMINDISAGEDPQMFALIASRQVPYIMMHKKGSPADMQLNPEYDDVLSEVQDYFIHKVHQAREAGIHDILIDPGFGFGKSLTHNYHLLNGLEAFQVIDCPILAGISRKSMICKVLQVNPEKALNGTTALHMTALMKGAKILRVHDVKEAKEAVKLFEALEL